MSEFLKHCRSAIMLDTAMSDRSRVISALCGYAGFSTLLIITAVIATQVFGYAAVVITIGLFAVMTWLLARYVLRSISPSLKPAIGITQSITVGYLENVIDASGYGEYPDLLRALAALQEAQVEVNDRIERQIHETENAYYNMERSTAALNLANQNLAALNASNDAMLSALEQGLFSFGFDGMCSDVFSKACLKLIGSSPSGQHISQFLKLSADDRVSVDRVLNMMDPDAGTGLDIEDLFPLLPDTFVNSDSVRITLSYHAIFDGGGKIKSILAIATDHTAEDEALQVMRDHEAEALSILRISSNRNMFAQFYRSISNYFTSADQAFSDKLPLNLLKRDIHTFKGNASIFHLQKIVQVLHSLENRIENLNNTSDAQKEIKVMLPEIQAALTMVHKQAYDLLGKDFENQGLTRMVKLNALSKIADQIKELPGAGNIYGEFVETLMGEPIRVSLSAFEMGLQELADRYGKKVSPCYFTGTNFAVFTENYTALFATLTHIARNIISHAIEEPDIRREQGKEPELTVIIETKKYKIAEQEWFSISFEDDGSGINVPRLREKLSERLSPEKLSALSDQDIMGYIFEDSMSTKEEADELSGRGVGMGAIKYEAEKLGGSVAVDSELGQFTKITIDLPLIWERPA